MISLPLRNLNLACLSFGTLATLSCFSAQAQVELASNEAPASALTSSSLPDAPSATAATASPAAPEMLGAAAFQQGALSNAPTASKYAMVIQPGQTAPRISAHTKVVAGLKDSLNLTAVIGWAVSAGYEQLVDSSPNYGEFPDPAEGTGKQFAQRLGAAAARATSENIFTESILAPVLHEDARYYRMGKGHNFVKRLVYSGTREIFTRTDGGHQTLNIANLGGNLAGSALTQAYYPNLNRGFNQVMQTFGGSVGGSALGYVVAEFLPDILHRGRQ